MLTRILEAEVMNTAAEAGDYDAMDHSQVNRLFASDLLASGANASDMLDLGTGTAQIPIEVCQQSAEADVVAVDAAWEMLRIADGRVSAARLKDRITLAMADAKRLPFIDRAFSTVVSNSIVHHIPKPREVMAEAARVCRWGGKIFFRDLLRPADEATLNRLVMQYADGCNSHQRTMFAESLRAALSLEEVREIVVSLGFEAENVRPTSDRHWTWRSSPLPDDFI